MTNFTFNPEPDKDELETLMLADQLCDLYGFPRELAGPVTEILEKYLDRMMNACSDAIKETEALPSFKHISLVDKAKVPAVVGSLICVAIERWLKMEDRLEHSATVIRMAHLHTRLKDR